MMAISQAESEEQALEQAYANWLNKQMYQQESWADTHLNFIGGNYA